MRIYLPTVGLPPHTSAVREFEQLARMSSTRRHELVSDPDSADVLMYTECHQLGDPISLNRIRRTEEFRTYRDKIVVFDQRPRAYCSMPGLYTSVPWRSLHPQYQIPWSYHQITDQPYSADDEPDLLFSFVGTIMSHPCRPPLLGLAHPRGLVRQVEGHVPWHTDDEGFEDRKTYFAETLRRSAFVLCPRGRATSSFRFYETLAAGRVPVVMADDWIPPWGIDFSEFAIRWPERSVAGLVEFLERHEDRGREMGLRAREVYETRFAPEVMWDNIGDALAPLAASHPWSHFPTYGYPPDRRIVRHVAGRGRKIAQAAKSRLRGMLPSG
jgi:hypothetical protein